MNVESMTESQAVAEQFRWQAHWCVKLGSPLYGRLMSEAAADIQRSGAIWRLLRDSGENLREFGVALRFMGAVHRLVLQGEAPELARFYPSAGGTVDLGATWPAFLATIEQHGAAVGSQLDWPVQTNEVARSAALLGGFLEVARQTGMPLRLLEIGASAGLNLRWDRYFYSDGSRSWGNEESAVRFNYDAEHAPPLRGEAIVGSRRGCDMQPLDPASAEDRLNLKAYVWPDQTWRFETLSAALEEAQASPVLVEQADAADWLENALSESVPGVATVVYHSVVLFYLDDARRDRVQRAIRSLGEKASKHRPLAWLTLEAGEDGDAEVRLTTWPGGSQRLLAKAGYQGPPIRWLAQ